MKRVSTSAMNGFTAVEMLVTIIVATIFTVALYQLFMVVNQNSSSIKERAVASELAYSYLRQYSTSDGKPVWFTCDAATGSSNTNDMTINANASGQVLTSGTLTDVNGIAGSVTYSVKAVAPYGCNDTDFGSPVRVEASVTYSARNIIVRHATLVGY